uniref:Uncharacterized protein n=1 Tax=Mycena chlorophos TaxID=658473 RepID=A0ABQ0LZ41_MYCCL|nr:predicted protein [Mycena chlorophos]
MRAVREFLLYGDDGDPISQVEPEMWQPTYGVASKPTWGDVMPLSASYIRREVTEKSVPPEDVDEPRQRRSWRPSRKATQPASTSTRVTEGLALTVMISMPSPDDSECLYHLGSLQIPWKDNV